MGQEKKTGEMMSLMGSISKGEFPFLLSALPYLKEEGVMAAVSSGRPALSGRAGSADSKIYCGKT